MNIKTEMSKIKDQCIIAECKRGTAITVLCHYKAHWLFKWVDARDAADMALGDGDMEAYRHFCEVVLELDELREKIECLENSYNNSYQGVC